jgi:hypothetical protein
MKVRVIYLMVAALAAVIASAPAQSAGDFNLSWGRVGAGGVSRAGDWEIYGTLGQPSAGTASGSGWAVQGGFWNRVSANLSPVARVATFFRPKNLSLKIPIANLLTNASDPDGESPLLAGTSSPSTNGATVMTNASFVFYNPPAINGNVTDRFPYRVKDGFQGLGASTVQVMITGSADTAPNVTAFTTMPDGNKKLNFAGIPYYSYLVQVATNLVPPTNWVTLATNAAGSDGLWEYIDLDATNYPSRYYRSALP